MLGQVLPTETAELCKSKLHPKRKSWDSWVLWVEERDRVWQSLGPFSWLASIWHDTGWLHHCKDLGVEQLCPDVEEIVCVGGGGGITPAHPVFPVLTTVVSPSVFRFTLIKTDHIKTSHK